MSEVIIYLSSFGFKHGLPEDANFIIDVRCLPNPYWIDELRDGSGFDSDVYEYVFSSDVSRSMLEQTAAMLDTYARNTKREDFRVYVGCTGGRHRSVSFVRALDATLKERGYDVRTSLRESFRFIETGPEC